MGSLDRSPALDGGQTSLSNNELPAAFWDALPDEEHPDLQAIMAIKDETSPDERVEVLKNQGNDAFRRGIQLKKKFYIKEAIQKYTEAANVEQWSDRALRSAVLSNKAQAHLRIDNNRNALDDAIEALQLDSTNTKAAFRGASAATRLKEFETAERLIADGLRTDPDHPELLKLTSDVKAKAEAARAQKEREAARKMAEQAPSRKLASTLLKKGWQVGAPQTGSPDNQKPFLGDDGLVHWPVLFMYPEVLQNDVVQDVCEADTLQVHLDEMYGPHAPPLEWDTEKKYGRESIELYYFSYAATPLSLSKLTEALHSGWPSGHDEEGPQKYGKKASKPIRVKETSNLAEILQKEDYIIPGVPVFFVLAKGTLFRDRFLESVL